MNDDNDNRRAYHDDVDDADYGRVPDSYTCLMRIFNAKSLALSLLTRCSTFLRYVFSKIAISHFLFSLSLLSLHYKGFYQILLRTYVTKFQLLCRYVKRLNHCKPDSQAVWFWIVYLDAGAQYS